MKLSLPVLLLTLSGACQRVPQSGVELSYSLADTKLAKATAQVLERRLASFELRGVRIETDAAGLVVRLPGVSKAAAIREVLERPGRLELCAVDDAGSERLIRFVEATGVEAVADPATTPLPPEVNLEREAVREATAYYLAAEEPGPLRTAVRVVGPLLGAGRVLRLGGEPTGPQRRPRTRTYLLETPCWPMGERIAEVKPGETEWGGWHVNLGFTAAGGTEFAALTAKNVGRRIAIVLDDEVLSAPVVMEEIRGGRAMVTLGHGNKSAAEMQTEAERLAFVLRGGALPTAIVLERERIFGP